MVKYLIGLVAALSFITPARAQECINCYIPPGQTSYRAVPGTRSTVAPSSGNLKLLAYLNGVPMYLDLDSIRVNRNGTRTYVVVTENLALTRLVDCKLGISQSISVTDGLRTVPVTANPGRVKPGSYVMTMVCKK